MAVEKINTGKESQMTTNSVSEEELRRAVGSITETESMICIDPEEMHFDGQGQLEFYAQAKNIDDPMSMSIDYCTNGNSTLKHRSRPHPPLNLNLIPFLYSTILAGDHADGPEVEVGKENGKEIDESIWFYDQSSEGSSTQKSNSN